MTVYHIEFSEHIAPQGRGMGHKVVKYYYVCSESERLSRAFMCRRDAERLIEHLTRWEDADKA